ncbi:MAG: polyribonucleotide nucleotidyltransferase [Candidatus Latescibacteria bacterium]|nr:polyribonucleotide nucleotidyltransferase [Candidatus Latescibacterota bacterium]
MAHRVDLTIGGRVLSLETGKVAKQADGAVWVRYGDTVVLATAVSSKQAMEGRDFLPLTVDYREKMYAAGRIPGGRLKREGPPSEKETISARLIDHAIRPLFPKDYACETQVMIIVLSSDQENDADILGIIGASAALTISDIPFAGPLAASRVGRVNGEYVINPTFPQLDESDLDIVVTGTPEYIVSLEGGAHEIVEADMLVAISLAHEQTIRINEQIERLRTLCGRPKREHLDPKRDETLVRRTTEIVMPLIHEGNRTVEKQKRGELFSQAEALAIERLRPDYPESETVIKEIVRDAQSQDMHEMIKTEGRRVDGRGMDDIRPVSSEVGVLPRTHGSALFSRGETQCLAVTTLGSKLDELRMDDLEGETFKTFMLHYNFPPFCTGETRPQRGPRPREIGHGALAERAIATVIPSDEVFPYTIRIVSDVFESNSSSSMATVCAASLSLMDAGVPITSHVAGVNVGLIPDEPAPQYLTDIQGVEDHLGGMDFKVAGTRQGITAFQMDVKVITVTLDVLRESLERARAARLSILDRMEQTIPAPRPELSAYAPRIITLKVKVDQIGTVIGPGGKMVRSIQDETGTKINIENDGTITIAAVDPQSGEMASRMIRSLVEEPELGKLYSGKVKRIVDFGAFVEILPGQDGLVHISEWDTHRVKAMREVANEGDEVRVKIIGIDAQGKIKLSRKAVMQEPHTEGTR